MFEKKIQKKNSKKKNLEKKLKKRKKNFLKKDKKQNRIIMLFNTIQHHLTPLKWSTRKSGKKNSKKKLKKKISKKKFQKQNFSKKNQPLQQHQTTSNTIKTPLNGEGSKKNGQNKKER